jgi:excinuclease UvrABC ATPase subunit
MVVEHNLHVITAADWLIDMGPEAGSEGGKIIYNGELSDCLSVNKSATINCLKTSLVK